RHDVIADDVESDKDEVYKAVRDAYEKYDGKNDVEFLWRLARGAYKAASKAELKGDKKTQLKLLLEAEEWAKKAVEASPQHAEAHSWYAFVCGKLSDLVSVKDRIQKGKLVKTHLEEAIKYKPDDAGLYYTYGRWCMEVAKLTWIERKLAETLLDKPPEATYEDAVKQFLEAQKRKPDWKANYFYLGKSYVNLKNYKEAIKNFDRSAECKVQDEEDQCVEKELLAMRNKYANYR
ncbi:regulator of microtubule dynamics protein 2-like protein, partial [Dinothrombium tinctorium]